MININKINVLIILIFVIIFVVYLGYENNLLKQKESFVGQNEDYEFYNNAIEVFTNIMKVNETEKEVIDNRVKVLEVLRSKKFVFSNIIRNKFLKQDMNNAQTLFQKCIKFMNRAINICSKFVNNEFLKNLKILLVAKKDLYELYVKYYDANFNFVENVDNKQNNIILANKLKLQDRVIQNHDNLEFQIKNVRDKSTQLNVNENMIGLYETYVDSEKLKNEQMAVLIENSSIYSMLNNLKSIKTITNENIKVYKNVILTKKNVLTNLSKMSDNQNDNINKYLKDGLSVVSTKPEEINYLHSANNNSNTLIKFCKKMRKLDAPSEGGLMFKRFNKEFKKKKNNQIKKLEVEIEKIINTMTEEEVHNFNLYISRTNDQAGKQLEAIKLAKDNLDNAKKLKLNIS